MVNKNYTTKHHTLASCPHPTVSHTKQGGHLMLASTIQISNNNPTNPQPESTDPDQAKGGTKKPNPHPTTQRQ